MWAWQGAGGDRSEPFRIFDRTVRELGNAFGPEWMPRGQSGG